MIRYVLRRLAMMLLVLVGVAFVVFSIMELTPGDPAVMMLAILFALKLHWLTSPGSTASVPASTSKL